LVGGAWGRGKKKKRRKVAETSWEKFKLGVIQGPVQEKEGTLGVRRQ